MSAGVVPLIAASSGDPTNPLKGSLSIRDPASIIKCGNTYYTYGTGGGTKTSIDPVTWNNGTATGA